MSEIHELLNTLNARIAAYRNLPAGINDLGLALASGRVVDDAEALLKALQIRTFEPAPDTDDRSEHVVITVHGVDLSIRGRTVDLFVHVEDERDREERDEFPLVVEVNNGGENTYG